MQNFMTTLLICSVSMSILAIVYMIATPLLGKRYSAKGRYYAWLVIIIGLIIPFRPQFSNAIVRVQAPTQTTTATQLGGDIVFFMSQEMFFPTSVGVATDIHTGTVWALEWWQVGFALWLVGAVSLIAYQGVRHYRFIRATKCWREEVTDEQALSILNTLKPEMGVKKSISIYHCSLVSSPMLTGVVNPAILLPTVDLAEDELMLILKHELIHYKRQDILYKFALLVATAIHWFNPAMCLMLNSINALCEASCDSEVVQGADAHTRQKYIEVIIGVAKYQSSLKTALSTSFYGGKKEMKNRILSIVDTGKKKTGTWVVGGVLALTIGTGAMVTVNASDAANQEMTEIMAIYGMSPFFDAIPMNEIFAESVFPVLGDVDLMNRIPTARFFAEYEEWGITIEGFYPHPTGGFIANPRQNVFFQGELVRGFSDIHLDMTVSISSADKGADEWINVVRDVYGNIVELEIS